MNPYSIPGIDAVDRIVKSVAKAYGITESALFDGRRYRTHAEARMMIWLFATRIGKMSQTKLSQMFRCSCPTVSLGISRVIGYAKFTRSTGEKLFIVGRELGVKDEIMKGWVK